MNISFNNDVASLLKTFIGKNFKRYRCDPFIFSNSVYSIVGLFIDDAVFQLKNECQVLDCFGAIEDVAVLTLSCVNETDITSGLEDIKQIDTPINEKIKEIHLVQENQRLYKDGEQTYDVWVTRGIIFFLESGREISFEKAVWFSEDIYINKGYNLIDTFESTDDFAERWEESEGYRGECERKIVVIK